ncbi:MAG TPA: hypothetical protein VL400_13340 [Polyangiaceae bacterium]|jgi:hypothetical protein|nr:hypothetical protein [Polyangiaceae bacterium]
MIRRRVLPVLVGIGAISGGAAGCGDAEKKTTASAHAEPTTTVAGTTTATTAPTAAPTTTVLKQGDPIPIRMGGAIAPMPRPSSSVSTTPAPPKAMAQGGAAAPGAAAPAQDSAPVAALQIVHNHPPDQPCQPLTDAEVKKALGDLN